MHRPSVIGAAACSREAAWLNSVIRSGCLTFKLCVDSLKFNLLLSKGLRRNAAVMVDYTSSPPHMFYRVFFTVFYNKSLQSDINGVYSGFMTVYLINHW